MKPKSRIAFKDLILYEDANYLVINKPPFVSTLEDRVDPDNLLAMARTVEPDAQAGHRLDKDTSGVLAFARNAEAYRHISMQFEHRTVRKVYHAVVDGNHDFTDVEVTARILKQPDGMVKLSSKGKDARTTFSTLAVYSRHSLVECRPVTGRMHQIRIHLASLGAPITGDDLYGGKPFFISSVKRHFRIKKETEEQPVMKRMALHAFALEFKGLDDQVIRCQAPYPKDFSALQKQLSANVR
ncbi:MAG: RNA pseudouridine synthase [Cyclobacteriaceae bacterium]|nr:RNA pseudouridine synthase [Cyclobacteriaceae bacterium]